MSYSEATEAPIPIEMPGREMKVFLKLLTQRDYLPWLAELTEQQRVKDRAAIPPTLKGQERFALARRIEMTEVTPSDLEPIIFTAKGTIRILEMAIVKAIAKSAGEADQAEALKEAQAFIDSRGTKANEELAARVSALFTTARLAEFFPPPPQQQYAALINLLIKKGAFTEAEFLAELNLLPTMPEPEETRPNVPPPPAGGDSLQIGT